MYYMHVALLLSCVYISVEGHGRLIEPPSRASMWRYGFENPPNYNDNELFCGGFHRQWNQNGGLCGVCGDPYDGVRQHEAGGKYANGIIVREYSPNDVMDITVEITADHKGWFEFRMCQQNDPSTPAQQQCFDEGLLQFVDGTTRYYLPSSSVSGQKHELSVRLPAVTCTQCIVQWKYHTGNNWGCDSPDDCGLGKGPQEEFYGCADVSILGDVPTNVPTYSTMPIVTCQPSGTPNTNPSTPSSQPSVIPITVNPTSGSTCHATGPWEGQASMDEWCRMNCAVGHCPPTHCTCDPSTGRRPARTGECNSFISCSGSQLENLICEYTCLFENTCPAGCLCSSNTPTIQLCDVTSQNKNSESKKTCSIMCSYRPSSCPTECSCN